jgi:hypothetical protein
MNNCFIVCSGGRSAPRIHYSFAGVNLSKVELRDDFPFPCLDRPAHDPAVGAHDVREVAARF